MKTLIAVLSGMLLLCACSSKKDQMILGKWKVEEYWVSGNKLPSVRVIEFNSDGTYTSYGEDLAEVRGEWRIAHEAVILYQPEISDMHGNRVADSFSRKWHITLAPEWLVMEGTAESQTQDVKLVLRKDE